MFKGEVTFDPDADVLYVKLRDLSVRTTKPLDDLRLIDYSEDGEVVGVEFVSAADGIDLSDLPDRREIEHLIEDSGEHIRIVA